MDSAIGALAGAVGTVAFFAFVSFACWLDYRRKKDDRDAAHLERMKALELGHAPLDAEVERAKAYAAAAWAAGLIGLLVPLATLLLTVVGTIVAVIYKRPTEDISVPLIVAWSIAAGIALVSVALSLSAIRRLPRPTVETPRRLPANVQSPQSSPSAFEERISTSPS